MRQGACVCLSVVIEWVSEAMHVMIYITSCHTHALSHTLSPPFPSAACAWKVEVDLVSLFTRSTLYNFTLRKLILTNRDSTTHRHPRAPFVGSKIQIIRPLPEEAQARLYRDRITGKVLK